MTSCSISPLVLLTKIRHLDVVVILIDWIPYKLQSALSLYKIYIIFPINSFLKLKR